MANYTDKPKKKNTSASRDIAVDKLDFYSEPHPRRKQDKIKGRPKSGWQRFCIAALPQTEMVICMLTQDRTLWNSSFLWQMDWMLLP